MLIQRQGKMDEADVKTPWRQTRRLKTRTGMEAVNNATTYVGRLYAGFGRISRYVKGGELISRAPILSFSVKKLMMTCF